MSCKTLAFRKDDIQDEQFFRSTKPASLFMDSVKLLVSTCNHSSESDVRRSGFGEVPGRLHVGGISAQSRHGPLTACRNSLSLEQHSRSPCRHPANSNPTPTPGPMATQKGSFQHQSHLPGPFWICGDSIQSQYLPPEVAHLLVFHFAVSFPPLRLAMANCMGDVSSAWLLY